MKTFFYFTNWVQRIVIKQNHFFYKQKTALEKLNSVLIVLLFATEILYLFFWIDLLLNLAMAFAILWFISQYILGGAKPFVSVVGFLTSGSIAYFFIATILCSKFMLNFHSENFTKTYILMITVYGVLWNIYSCIVNHKVSEIGNAFISTVIGIIILVKDVLLSLIPDDYTIMDPKYLPEAILNLYSYKQLLEITCNIVLSPFLAINIFAIFISMLKGYWVEKYNGGEEINSKDIYT